MRLLILVITVSSILVSSCTIQKRTFRNGYYVSWNKSVKKDKTQSQDEVTGKNERLAGSTVSEDTICNTEPEEERSVCEKPDTLQVMELAHVDDSVVKNQTVQYSETALLERLHETVESIKEKKYPDLLEETPKRKLNLFAPNAFVFALGYVILIFYAFEGSTQGWSIFLAVLCFFVAIIFAIVALVKWKRNRDKFWGTFFALMALILIAAGSLVFLVYALFSSASFG